MLRKARVGDVAQIRQLINVYAQQEVMLPRAIGELYENIRDFFVIEKEDRIIACGALHVTWEEYGEILSLAVSTAELRKGHGSRILEECLEEAPELGIKHLVTLTYAREFFEHHGFKVVDKSTLPHKLWSMCVKCPRFPDCDEIAMIKELE
ncbi:MAG: N-acetyltransferase [Methanosarcinales archaeon]|nr:N-acetyltransferase [Methanosarcinales archaeon]